MKKIFSIFAAMLVAVAVNATVIQITPTSPHSSDNLRQAVASAVTGDIIEMAAGTYEESASDYIAFHGKEVVVRAAEGAEVIVKTAVPIRLKTGGRAEFDGIKFDCENLTGYSNLIVPADDEINKRVILNNCEFYNWTKNSALIQSTSSRRLDSIVINNCYFHNCEKSMVFVENANLVGLEIKNSTFANITATVTDSYYAAPIYVKATTGKVLVDHCTFYNVESMSLSYGVVSVDAIADATVSNCIFMLPATVDRCATNLKAGGDVKNTLTYNYDNWQPYGHFNTATLTDCVKADPLFVAAATADYTLGDGSPALNAGDDGSHLGDPRWYPVVAPTFTDFDINFMTDPYTATLPAGVSVAGSFHDAQHGYSSPKVTIPVLAGNYKITIGNCVHSNNDGASIKNADESATLNMINANGQTITSILAKDNCYHQDPTNNFTCVWFVADADQTINVLCPQYTPYFKIEKVDAVPEAVTVYTATFINADGATGIVPAAIGDLAMDAQITLPNNYTMYKEGATFTGWTDGLDSYAPGATYTIKGNINLVAEYQNNTVSLDNRPDAVTIKWLFSQADGVAPINVNGGETFVVAQAVIDAEEIDVKLPIDATAGKVVNSSNTWTQINPGVIFSIPSAKDAVISYKLYDAGAVTTPEINVTASDAVYNLAAEGTAGQLYIEYIQVVLPKTTATGINNTDAESKAIKRIENGVLVIEKNGVKYNAQGAVIK